MRNVTNASVYQVREEFDRIALLTERHGSLSDIYRNYLLRHVPSHSQYVLDVGCGTGEFTRRIASRAQNVVAIDLSSEMIRLAKSQSANYQNIQYVLGDIMSDSLPAERYDCIVSLATLHHLPLGQALIKMKDALKPNGVLIIQDLVAAKGLVERVRSGLAYPVSGARRFWKTGRIRAPREIREAWAEHGKGEVYLTLDEVREMCKQHLPDARIRRHLLWRYTVVWSKREATSNHTSS